MRTKIGNPFPFSEDLELQQKSKDGVLRKVRRQMEEELSHKFAKDVVLYNQRTNPNGDIFKTFFFQGQWITYSEFVVRWSHERWLVIGTDSKAKQQQTDGENTNAATRQP